MSADHDGLLDAILANPDDDTPRLVLADWLDENGQGARAAFIRAQLEGARLEREAHAVGLHPPPEARARHKEADRLYRAHLAEFRTGLPPSGKGFGIHFRRGLPEEAYVKDSKTFFKDADRAFAAAPILTLGLNEFDPGLLEKALATGHLRRVKSLTLVVNGGRAAPWTQMAALVASSTVLPNLRELTLATEDNKNAGSIDPVAQALAEGERGRALSSLRFWINGSLSSDGVRSLARLDGLEDLWLPSSGVPPIPLGPGAVAELARSFPRRNRSG